jgi:Ca-activated chloride channel family protein
MNALRVAIAAFAVISLTIGAERAPELHVDLRVDVPLVLVNVNVTNGLGIPVPGMDQSQFHVFENGVEQKITHFSSEDAPISIAIVFDASDSMRRKLRTAHRALHELLRESNPEDEFALIVFNRKAKLVVPFTQEVGEIEGQLGDVRAEGRTALLDAIHTALVEMKQHARYKRKAVVILSDGGDNQSRYTEREIRAAIWESDVQIYAVGIFDAFAPHLPREEARGPQLLSHIAEDTGGRHFPVDNLGDLPEICRIIGRQLRNQYVLGFVPADPERDGKFRRVQVKVDDSGLRVHARAGYYAPAN